MKMYKRALKKFIQGGRNMLLYSNNIEWELISFGRLLKASGCILLVSVLTSLIFTEDAQMLTIIAVLIGSFFIAKTAKKHELLQAVLMPLPAILILQLVYFSNRGGYFPAWIVAVLFILNTLSYVLLSAIGGFLPWFVRWIERRENDLLDKNRTDYSRLFSIVLLTVMIGNILVAPFSVTYAAECSGSNLNNDQFLSCYDPHKTYQIKPILLPPSNAQGSIHTGTGSNVQNQETNPNQSQNGSNVTVTKTVQISWWDQATNLWKSATSSVSSTYTNVKNALTKSKSTDSRLTKVGKFVAGVTVGVGEGIYQNTVGLVVFTTKGIGWLGGKVVNAVVHPIKTAQAVVRAVTTAAKGVWGAITHPIQTAQNVVRGVNTVFNTAKTLYDAGNKIGYGNLAKSILFSPEAVQAFQDGDYGYAIGRGASELAFNIAAFAGGPIALTRIAKIPAVGVKIARTIGTINEIQHVISPISAIARTAPKAADVLKDVTKALGTGVIEAEITITISNPHMIAVTEKVAEAYTSSKQIAKDTAELLKGGNTYNRMYDNLAFAVDKQGMKATEAGNVITKVANDTESKLFLADEAGSDSQAYQKAINDTKKINSNPILTKNGIEVKGFVGHGVDQAIDRRVTPQAILDTIKNPELVSDVKINSRGEKSQAFSSKTARIIVNPETGKIVTVMKLGEKRLNQYIKSFNK